MKRFNDWLYNLLPLITLLIIFYCILCYLDFHHTILPNPNR